MQENNFNWISFILRWFLAFCGFKAIFYILPAILCIVVYLGGLLGIFEQGKPKKEPLGVCIPDHAAKKRPKGPKEEETELRATESEITESSQKGFVVEGIFHVLDSLMVQGTANGVSIKKRMVTDLGGTKLTVVDILMGQKKVGSLNSGDSGALFLKANNKGKNPFLRTGDVLKF